MKRTLCTRLAIFIISFALAFPGHASAEGPDFALPLEKNNFGRITSSAEISEYLASLDRQCSLARKELLGLSVERKPLEALILAETKYLEAARSATPDRLTLLLVGSQHGTEPSGAEALLFVARDLVMGPLRHILAEADVIVIPNANPDGREARRRANKNKVNLSTDFVLLSQPESQALNDALFRWQPEAILDVHESAILKKESLGREGYLTDFETQFEITNNPNVDAGIRSLSLDYLLPEMITRVQAQGLSAQRYIGEITSTGQAITNGGLSVRNMRNKAGMLGSFAFLVENRLDPSDGTYPTPRNIQGRVAKQVIGIKSWIEVIHGARDNILTVANQAKVSNVDSTVWLHAAYVQDEEHPQIEIRLRKRGNGEAVHMGFADHRTVARRYPMELPQAYFITAYQERFQQILDRNGFRYEFVKNPVTKTVMAQRLAIADSRVKDGQKGLPADPAVLSEREVLVTCRPGALWIDVAQPFSKLLVLLLEPRSSSSVFRDPSFADLLTSGEPCTVLRVKGNQRAILP